MPDLDPTPYGLALHTTSPQLGLALSNFAEDTRSSTWDLGRDLSTHLHQHLVEFLLPQSWANLAFIAVAKGPGGFTGTRIGVVTARTLAQQLNLPLFGISTLAARAWSQAGKGVGEQGSRGAGEQGSRGAGERILALQMPAQRGQVFTAIYQTSSDHLGLIQRLPDAVMLPDAWKQTLDTLEMPYQLIDVPANLSDAMSVLELAYLEWRQGKCPHWSEALPFYGQHPVEGN